MPAREKIQRYSLQKVVLWLLFLAAIWANVKSIFMNFDVDTEYAAAMSYRMLQGDRMFQQMWEPHQTSAFLCTLLMKLYVAVTGGTAGVIIYLQAAGVLIHGAITFLFYSFLKNRTDLSTARLMSIYFLAARPKDIVFPEYSNMQIWFSMLLFLCLVYYLEHQNQKVWLFLASVCLCLEMISYPSCVVVWLAVVILLWIYSDTRWKNILLFSGACLLQGCVYVWYFIVNSGGLRAFLEALFHIVASDTSHHQSGKAEISFFFANFRSSVLLVAICFLAAFAVSALIVRKKNRETGNTKKSAFAFLFGIFIFIAYFIKTSILADRMGYAALYVLVIVAALCLVKHCGAAERRLVVAGILTSVGSFVATALLTNLDLSSIFMYLILGVAVSFLPLRKHLPGEVMLFHKTIHFDLVLFLCMVVLFQRGATVKTYTGFSSPVHLGGVIRSGPATGIVTDYLGAYIRNTSREEWSQYVNAGDNLFIVEQGGVSALGYLYEDTGVAVPSTICTPTFDETLLEYWEQYPEKYPDVVAVQCWYGEMKVDSDSWIVQWLETEGEPVSVEDGTFWRYYRLKSH